jgi:very-short-patch-repair endonuclease
VDFAIFVKGIAKEEIKIVVECDGHDFHEKTKGQVARDKSRVRDLEIAGWRVLRFPGSGYMRGTVLQLLTLKSEGYGTPPDETAV